MLQLAHGDRHRLLLVVSAVDRTDPLLHRVRQISASGAEDKYLEVQALGA
ncbi:hypothetical protein OHA79_04035 [Streptomyces sp. NBC_00841]|nr:MULTISPECIES: hypothetical protein [unclassified Streptomyces]MCX4537637.1 hypothetical protein [Streptomyces sp. NBC_01669]WRZ97153.1 hypothetical protein OHA79_04035 [Streptomyces sp. NBC_00841]